MSDWTDEDGNDLGVWVPITCEARGRIVAALGGIESLNVFAAHTDVERGHFYTEWGVRSENAPKFSDDVHRDGVGETCEHRVYVLFPACPVPNEEKRPSHGGTA